MRLRRPRNGSRPNENKTRRRASRSRGLLRHPYLAWPVVLAALSLFGLLSALLGQGGIWWLLSWIALGIPLFAIFFHLYRHGRTGSPHP